MCKNVSHSDPGESDTDMRRALTVIVMFLVSLPGLSFAGSLDSRWDLVIGGYVRFDAALEDGGRQGYGANENPRERYGTLRFNSVATRLNFLTRGPDAWGAKTSAFVEGDFIGVYAGAGRGSFSLRHAFMAFDWPQTRLVMGQTFARWGFLPTYTNLIIGGADLAPFVKGHRQPMIRVEQKVARDWTMTFAVMSPANTLGSDNDIAGTGTVDGFTRSSMPFYEGTVTRTSERYGRIGAWRAMAALEGFYGQDKRVVTRYTGTSAAPTSLSFDDRNVNSWGVALKGFFPVIPEKKGNKKGALSVSGVAFTASNPSWLQSRAYEIDAYARPGNSAASPMIQATAPLPSFTAPRVLGIWGQASYFLTEKLILSGWYGYLRNDTTGPFDAALRAGRTGAFLNANEIQNTTQYIGSLCYDVNDAVRFGAEYSYFISRYVNYGTLPNPSGPGRIPNALSKDGVTHALRIGAWYFF